MKSIARLSKKQKTVMNMVAIGLGSTCEQKTLDSLMKQGFLKQEEETYYMPLAVHRAWCQWCSEQREPSLGEKESNNG